jgi:polyhydroxyalkanoate synthase
VPPLIRVGDASGGQYLPTAVDAIAGDGGGERVLLAGHSLGGTLAAIFATLNPDRVRGLVLL